MTILDVPVEPPAALASRKSNVEKVRRRPNQKVARSHPARDLSTSSSLIDVILVPNLLISYQNTAGFFKILKKNQNPLVRLSSRSQKERRDWVKMGSEEAPVAYVQNL